MIYDAENQVLGRLASRIAKQLLKGEKIFVVNSEKAVLSGDKKFKTDLYLKKRRRGDPKHGPFFPREPDKIFHRTVRGMLPWHKPKGRKVYKNLKVFIGIPEEFKSKKLEKVKDADASKLKTTYITLEELSLGLGARKRW
jgi:large subunit ribosomal protein L13